MTSYLRPDDGVAQQAEMVEIRPGQFVNRIVAQQLGLAINGVRGGRRGFHVEATEPIHASEVVASVTLPRMAATTPPKAAPEPPAAPITPPVAMAPKVKRSLKEILAGGQ